MAVAGVVGGVGARLEMAGVTSPAASAFASGLTGAAARSLLAGSSFGDNLLSVLPDVIGQTIGGAVAGSLKAAQASRNLSALKTGVGGKAGVPNATSADRTLEDLASKGIDTSNIYLDDKGALRIRPASDGGRRRLVASSGGVFNGQEGEGGLRYGELESFYVSGATTRRIQQDDGSYLTFGFDGALQGPLAGEWASNGLITAFAFSMDGQDPYLWVNYNQNYDQVRGLGLSILGPDFSSGLNFSLSPSNESFSFMGVSLPNYLARYGNDYRARIDQSFDLFRASGDFFAEGWRSGEPLTAWANYAQGAGAGALGAVAYVASPITGASDFVFGRPAEQLTAQAPHGRVLGLDYDLRMDRQAAGDIFASVLPAGGGLRVANSARVMTLAETHAGRAVAVEGVSAARIGQLRSASSFLRSEAGIVDRAYRRQVIESFGSDMRVVYYSGTAYQYSGFSGTHSRYLTPVPLSNPIQELALPPSNSASIISQYSVAPGKVLIGTASPQNFGYPLTGGAQQIFVPSRSVLTPVPTLPQ